MAMHTVYIDNVIRNEGGSVEVQYRVDDSPVQSIVFQSQAELEAAAEPVPNYADAIRMAMASWLGVDPTGANPNLATQYKTEIDFGANSLVPVRRVFML